jgi:hypothetical protein
MNKRGQEIIKKMKDSCLFPYETSFAKIHKRGSRLSEIDKLSTDIYYLISRNAQRCGKDFFNNAIIIDE